MQKRPFPLLSFAASSSALVGAGWHQLTALYVVIASFSIAIHPVRSTIIEYRPTTVSAQFGAVSLRLSTGPSTVKVAANDKSGWFYTSDPSIAAVTTDAQINLTDTTYVGIIKGISPGAARVCEQQSVSNPGLVGCWNVLVNP